MQDNVKDPAAGSNASAATPPLKVVKLHKTTLGERGPVLPLGVPDVTGKLLLQDMAFLPWRTKEEKALAKLREDNKKLSGPRFVSTVLGLLSSSLAGHALSTMRSEVARLNISQMFMGDVIYAYVSLRIHAVGNDYPIGMNCPHCGESVKMMGDLRGMDVLTAETLEDAQWDFKLMTPLAIRGKTVSVLRMGPPRWGTLEAMPRADDLEVRANLVPACVHSIPDLPGIALAPHELDEMTKLDFERVSDQIDQFLIGPDMSFEMKCDFCKNVLQHRIQWTYENFFKTSSR